MHWGDFHQYKGGISWFIWVDVMSALGAFRALGVSWVHWRCSVHQRDISIVIEHPQSLMISPHTWYPQCADDIPQCTNGVPQCTDDIPLCTDDTSQCIGDIPHALSTPMPWTHTLYWVRTAFSEVNVKTYFSVFTRILIRDGPKWQKHLNWNLVTFPKYVSVKFWSSKIGNRPSLVAMVTNLWRVCR